MDVQGRHGHVRGVWSGIPHRTAHGGKKCRYVRMDVCASQCRVVGMGMGFSCHVVNGPWQGLGPDKAGPPRAGLSSKSRRNQSDGGVRAREL